MDGHAACLLLLLTFVHLSLCEDYVTGTISKSSQSESTSQSMPENVTVNVTVGGQRVRLELKLDRTASSDIPVYVFSTNKDGQADTERVHRKRSKHFAVYRDVTHGAVFSGRRDVDTDQDHLSLEGLMQVKGKVYDIKSSKRRHRNSTAAMADGKTGSQSHVQRRDVSGGNVTGSGENEAGESQEFVVRLRDDLPPISLRGDAITPPNTPETNITMRNFNPNLQQPPLTDPPRAAPPERQYDVSTQDVYIDVVAVVDYGVFRNWYANSSGITNEEKTQDVLNKLPEYYAFMFSGVNLIYEGITSLPYHIHVELTSIIIAKHSADSPWTEDLRVRGSPRDRVDSDTALDNFSKWAKNADLLHSYDHVILFTGYDMTSIVDSFYVSNTTIGVAWIGTMCSTDGRSASVVEDLRSFESVSVVAHEMGHSLSAKHDGIANYCYEGERYVMSAIYSPQTATNWHHLWQFSTCSINYFRTLISSQASTTRGRQCLYSRTTPSTNIPDVSGQQPGQVYDYDAQCRQVYGQSSRLCRGSNFFPNTSDICMSMWCDLLSNDLCHKIVAARGTSCGDKKWCVNGDCVYDSRAPAMDEKCPFGDLPGLFWNTSQTCEELIASHPYYCYQSFYQSRCCTSCARHYTPVLACQYGDKVASCVKSGCYNLRPSYLANCCETCSFLSSTTHLPATTHLPTTTTHLLTTTTTSYRLPVVTSTTHKTTRPTVPTLHGTTANTLCIDTPGRLYGKTCAERVAERPAQCYHPDILGCCASCRAHSNGVKGCEYGDRLPSECPRMVPLSPPCDARLEELCCQSCANIGDDLSRSSAAQWTVTSAFIGCLSWSLLRI